jgi:SAM-dependent methyltransferase
LRSVPDGLDTSKPNVARIYDYLLGGKDNFATDRAAAERMMSLAAPVQQSAIENRRFLRRAVRFVAGEGGIDQFLDIGVGLPTQGAVHEVAHEVNPRARVAYVDYDPVVVLHANALLAERDLSVVAQADVRRPAELLADPVIRKHIDFEKPVAVMLVAVLHFVPDVEDPARIVAAFRDAMAPGSYLVLSHVSNDNLADMSVAAEVKKLYANSSQPMTARSAERIRTFFDGFELLAPGVVPTVDWRPVLGERSAKIVAYGMAGVGRKP